MRQSIIVAASLMLAGTVYAQSSASTTVANLKPIQTLACYKSPDPLTEYGEYSFATDGWCQEQCGGQGHPVMALVAGSTCYCGDVIPPLDQQVAISSCNSPCNGYGTKNCGGIGFWQVYLTGLTTNVQTAANSSSSSSSSSSSGTTSSSPSVITKAGETVVVTAPPKSSNETTPSSGNTSKIGIAVGVVVGLIAIISIIACLIFFLKLRRRRAIEEEHKRNAALNEFMAGKKSETALSTDQRLDPVIFSHRRESIGSIADEMDYSRRILQVRNPDHRASQASAKVEQS